MKKDWFVWRSSDEMIALCAIGLAGARPSLRRRDAAHHTDGLKWLSLLLYGIFNGGLHLVQLIH